MPPFGTLPGRAGLARRPRRRLVVALRRQPVAFWTLALLAAFTGWWGTRVATEEASAGAEAYGSLVEVLVATHDIAAGEHLGPDDIRSTPVPSALVPADAIAELPPGATARDPLVAGEAVVTSRLAPGGARGIAAVLHEGQRAVAVPLDGHGPGLQVGQRVDVLATGATGVAATTRTVATDAEVLAVDDDGITIAVAVDDSRAVATALATAVVTVVVTPG